MSRRKYVGCVLLFIGAALTFWGLYLIDNGELDNYSGLLIGLGSGLAATGLVNILTGSQYKNHSQKVMLKEMAEGEERNLLIHYKTRAQIYNINLLALAALTIIATAARLHDWMKLLLISVMILNRFLYVIIFNKYKKEL